MLSGIFSELEKAIKDKNEAPIAGEEGQRKRWVEYFEEFLDRPAPKEPVDIQPASHGLPIGCTVPTKEEIWKALK